MTVSTYHRFLSAKSPLPVGIIGTGYAAKLRAQAIYADARTQLVAVAGRNAAKTAEFCQPFAAEPLTDWQQLLARADIDLVIIANVNRDRAATVAAALRAGKHVVAEYPLALDLKQAAELIATAKANGLFLHVEHIELLGSLHQTLRQHLPAVGVPFAARYSTIVPERPAPQRWTYQAELFGFPFMGAVSRITRFTDLFGTVAAVSCQAKFEPDGEFFRTCLCQMQLRFHSGLIGELVYGKGESLWQEERKFEIHGSSGGLIFDGDAGTLVTAEATKSIELGTRRGLFAQETNLVLNHLTAGEPLYTSLEASYYALQVADAARRSAETGETIFLP